MEKQQQSAPAVRGQGILEWYEALISAALVLVLIFSFFFRIIQVDGRSMVPTLTHGDKLIVWAAGYTPQRGDVVIVDSYTVYGKPLVKRIIAKGGDTISINYDADSWKSVATQGDKTVYAYVKKVAAKEAEKDITLPPVFTQVKVSENLTSEDIENLGEKNLNVMAYALQTASLDSKEAIDIAVKAFLGEDAKADRHITIEEAQ